MNQLHHGGEGDRILLWAVSDSVAEKKKGGPEELTPHEEKVFVDLLDQIEVRNDDSFQVVLDALEPIGNKTLHR